MVKLLAVLAAAITLNVNTCNFREEPAEDEPIPTDQVERVPEEQHPAEVWVKVNSDSARLDSLMNIKIDLPPVYYHNVLEANKEATDKFEKLSRATKSNIKILVSADIVSDEISKTINDISVANADLLILIDKTFSMDDDIKNAQEGLKQIMDTIRKYRGTRLAVATYGDKNVDGTEWFTFRNFETDYNKAAKYIDSIAVTGGGDLPESVYDAFFLCQKQNFWKSNRKRNIILIGDAPPLEKPLSDYSIDDVIGATKDSKIKMNFYPIIIIPQDMSEVKLSPAELATYQPERLAVTLYPNPSVGRIEVSMMENASYTLELYNMSGAQVLSEQFFGLHWAKDLDSKLANGTYVLRIIHENHKFETIKFVLQR